MNSLDAKLRQSLVDGKLPCATAHMLAQSLGLSPREIGDAATRLDLRISHCQLGLFGYLGYGRKRAVYRLDTVPERVATAVRSTMADGKWPCEAAWKLADSEGLPRLVAGCVAETLSIPVTPCQLGCF